LIPRILFIRTPAKTFLRVLCRKKIRIGLEKGSHVLLNFPIFRKGPITLGEKDPEDLPGVKKKISRFLFSVQGMKSDDLGVFLIVPKRASVTAVFFVILLILAFSQNSFSWKNSLQPQDWDLIPLPANSTYGFCRLDRSHPLGVRYGFSGIEGKPYRISFTTGGGEPPSTLGISLNGSSLEDEIKLPTGWGDEITLFLPKERVKTGPNEVVFRIAAEKNKNIYWGIKNVYLSSKIPDPGFETPESILEEAQRLIGQPFQKGIELARCFWRIDSINEKLTGKNLLLEKEKVRKEIEERMEKILKETVILAKSRRLMGDEESAIQIIREAKGWIPDNWHRGQEVLDGFLQ